MKISAGNYDIGKEDLDWVLDKFSELVGKKEFLSNGRYCREFEKEFAKYVGTKYALTTNSGTSALELIFRCLGVDGRKVLVPSNTFAATAFAVIRAGGIPIFWDISRDDLCLDYDSLSKYPPLDLKAICLVHIGGIITLKINQIIEFCNENNVYLVEDSAQAQGSSLNGKKAGSFGIASGFSFFSTKVMTCGEGGMVTSDDKELIERARILGDQAKINNKNYQYELGYNFRMTEFQALLGLSQLSKLDSMIDKRSEIARIYDEAFMMTKKFKALSFFSLSTFEKLNFYKYIRILEGLDRDTFKNRLKKDFEISMAGEVYEFPLHLQPCFEMYSGMRLPISEEMCRKMVCLPISSVMSEEEAKYVSSKINEVLG